MSITYFAWLKNRISWQGLGALKCIDMAVKIQ